MSDRNALTETERADLVREVADLRVVQYRGDYLETAERLLIRTAEHIEVLDQRIANFGKFYRIVDLDHQGQAKALEDIASALQAGDRAEAIEVLQKRGLWTE